MPSPNWGDFFFMMHRRTARTFATMYDVAETKPDCVVGCLDAASSLAIHRPNGNTRADAQLWKSAFLTLRANATLVPSRNGQPHDVPLYRNFGKDCRSAVRGNASAVRAELDAMEIDETLLDLTIRQTKHAFCPWLCRAFPNRTRVKCPSRQPPALAASCCV